MFYRFELDKALQAAGVLLHAQRGDQLSSLRLLKLLYLADRESLRLTGRPIIGNPLVAAAQGPQHREVAILLKGEHPEQAVWSQYIDRDWQVVQLVDDPGVSELSAQEIETLVDVARQQRELNDWELVELTRGLPEWRQSYLSGSARPMTLADILSALGFSASDQTTILGEFEDEERLERLLEAKTEAARP